MRGSFRAARAILLVELICIVSISALAQSNADRGALSQQIVQLMNTQVAGRYIFGGTKDSAPPFDASGNYVGDGNVRQIEIAPGLLQASSIRADVALKGTGGGIDVFGAHSL